VGGARGLQLIYAVVLAAGASSRYGASPPKQVELLPAVLEALRASSVDEVVVVSGAHPLPVESVHCAEWELGPGASLRCGLAALGDEVTHALVVLADGPELDPRAVERLLAHVGDAAVLAASYDGARSHPVLLARSVWASVPDDGGRALEATLVDCSDLTPPGDVDYRPLGDADRST
jgi:CTP:molybdopterin cytidylyltransferase MocA